MSSSRATYAAPSLKLRDLDRESRHNLLFLFLLQAFPGGQMAVLFVYSSLVALELAENKALATLPISAILLTTMCAAPAISSLMGRYGRRFGIMVGLTAGLIGCICSYLAIITHSFPLLIFGSVGSGIYFASQGLLRFAAIDAVPGSYAPKAVSCVLVGGLAASLMGIEIAIRAEQYLAFDGQYTGAYIGIFAMNLIGLVLATQIRIARPKIDPEQSATELFKPGYKAIAIIAILLAMIFYSLMNLIMTSTPLAMSHNDVHSSTIADVVRWHAFAMFAPSFFTGTLIIRYGHITIIAIGLGFMVLAQLIALMGDQVINFYLALIMLGVGWNFGFIGATTLLATTHLPQGQSRIQGINDFCIFMLVTLASVSSGVLIHYFGWVFVNLAMLPLLLVVSGLLIALYRYRRGLAAAAGV